MNEQGYCRNCGAANPTGATLCANCGTTLNPKRPWFGPKRVGYGIRPQTWQGWLIVAVFVAVVTGIALWLGR
jgi:predicted amidophosphoribosyltransferase